MGQFSAEIEAGLRSMGDHYRRLLERAIDVFDADARVRAMWLHGAMARGHADAGSDLDIDIAVRDEEFDSFTRDWQTWLAEITPTVSAVPIPGMPGSFFALTPDCERMDVITESVSGVAGSTLTRRLVVFDRDGIDGRVPPISDPQPDPNLARYVIDEMLRQAANFPTVAVRQDWLLGVVAVQQVHQHLYLLFAEANKPLPPTGPKQWSFKLSNRHRAMLEDLPVPQPHEASVLEARQAALHLLLTEGRRVAEEVGASWPHELADAVLGFLDRSGYPVHARVSSE